MKFTFSWLKDFLETQKPLKEITDCLILNGLEVESILDPSKGRESFIVGEILEATQHPNADRLKVCTVGIGGDAPLQVVCGAPNARMGLKVVFAPIGATIPSNGLVIKPTQIRGVESFGMLCSASELGFAEESKGMILELPEDVPVGESLIQALDLNDPIVEIYVTSNRSDCLGVKGVARDLAAASMGVFKESKGKEVPSQFKSSIEVKIAKGVEKACPLFTGRLLKNVVNKESPEWLKRRLTAIGIKPISALVDVTNYFAHDRCRPLHVFDADKIKGDIEVRFAKTGESLKALNEKDYPLDPSILVIADQEKPLSIAGVMGGLESGVTFETTSVFLEAAFFNPITVTKGARSLNILSDSRARFERGVDPNLFADLEAATALILQICGGEASEVVQAGEMPQFNSEVSLNLTNIEKVTGLLVEEEEVKQILLSLGCALIEETSTRITCLPPSWRFDLKGEVDLIEEILRIKGYDALKSTPLPPLESPALNILPPTQSLMEKVRRFLPSRGLSEIVTWSFIGAEEAEPFTMEGKVNPDLKLSNPYSLEWAVMRPSMLPLLLKSAERNLKRDLQNPCFFEIGPVFNKEYPDSQLQGVAGVRTGGSQQAHWLEKGHDFDVFEVKTDALKIIEACGIEHVTLKNKAPHWYHPGRSASLYKESILLGYFGEIHPKILKIFDIEQPVMAFEVFLSTMPAPAALAKPPFKASAFQPVERDFAFLVQEETPAANVISAICQVDPLLITDVSLFDVYRGKGVAEGYKSLALRVRLEPKQATLTEEEIQELMQKIITQVHHRTQGVLRT